MAHELGSSERKSKIPRIWVEERFKDLHRVVCNDRVRFANLGAIHAKYVEPQPTLDRTFQFWCRSAHIYATYKVTQLRVQFVKDEAERDRIWEEQHEKAADRLHSLCSDLRGFFLKTAQVLAKPDLVPLAWVKKLVVLFDQAPATPYPIVKEVVEEELGRPFDELFERFDVKPIGSASIAQVHKARLKGGFKDVAVKVQHPGAHELMMTDLRNQKMFGRVLQKTDLKFDVMSIMDEMEEQVEYEFDFVREANAMDRIGKSLEAANGRGKSPVIVPRSIPGLVTRRVLVMDFIEGTPIMQMEDEMAKRGINPNGRIAKMMKRSVMKDLSSAFGHMMLTDGFFQADPHPGNILINKYGKVALLDYGQTKDLPQKLKLGYAKVVLGLANDDTNDIKEAFRELGLVAEGKSKDPADTKILAQLMFDTQLPDGWKMASPFGDDSILKSISVESFPKEMFFVLRTAQLLRGLSVGMDVRHSAVQQWKPLAESALVAAGKSPTSYGVKPVGDVLPGELRWERRKRLQRGRLQNEKRSKGYRKLA